MASERGRDYLDPVLLGSEVRLIDSSPAIAHFLPSRRSAGKQSFFFFPTLL